MKRKASTVASFAAVATIAALVLLSASSAVLAQSTGPRDLAELKQEAQRRADRNLPPVGGVKSEDMREALANINNLEPDTWAVAFVRIGAAGQGQGPGLAHLRP